MTKSQNSAEPLLPTDLAKSFDSKLSLSQVNEKPATKDNRFLAIMATNFYAVTEVLQSIFFKLGAANGLSPVDFPLFRNSVLFVYATGMILYSGKSVTKSVPKELRFNMFLRCLLGQIHFFILNLSLVYVPLAAVQA